ncbi:MAG: biotin--[acetyl-CoA-carboxylase] ligase [Arenicellales bacterium]
MAHLSSTPFDFDKIRASLQQQSCEWIDQFEFFESIGSSNTELMRQDTLHGKVYVADFQTEGKGRLGKRWQSGAGSSLMFSLGWSPDVALTAPLSLVVGVALVDALRQLGVQNVGLKWPNDVLAGEAKLAGILVESKTLGARTHYVIGVGLNIWHQTAGLSEVEQAWTDLHALGFELDRTVILSTILIGLDKRFRQLLEHGFAPIRQDWLARHALQDARVSFQHGNEIREGKIMGINQLGALEIQTQNGLEVLHSGEINTVRLNSKQANNHG